MQFSEILALVSSFFTEENIVKADESGLQPTFIVPAEHLLEVCQILHVNPSLYFDFLNCITAVDNGAEKNTMEVIYHLSSIPYEHTLVVKVILPRNLENEELPKVPSVSPIWKTALWHEREAYDLMGINFVNHPDLRRILMPDDWVGHPLRKDYQTQELYHGITVKYTPNS